MNNNKQKAWTLFIYSFQFQSWSSPQMFDSYSSACVWGRWCRAQAPRSSAMAKTRLCSIPPWCWPWNATRACWRKISEYKITDFLGVLGTWQCWHLWERAKENRRDGILNSQPATEISTSIQNSTRNRFQGLRGVKFLNSEPWSQRQR